MQEVLQEENLQLVTKIKKNMKMRLKSLAEHLFFFQAEDGIRDDLVTGVQTCALPIFVHAAAIDRRGDRGQHDDRSRQRGRHGGRPGNQDRQPRADRAQLSHRRALPHRSEERRVGKEWSSRVSKYGLKYTNE